MTIKSNGREYSKKSHRNYTPGPNTIYKIKKKTNSCKIKHKISETRQIKLKKDDCTFKKRITFRF